MSTRQPIRNVTSRTSHAVQPPLTPGPYLAKVIGFLDKKYMGALEVQLIKTTSSGDYENIDESTVIVNYASPFYGVTSLANITGDDNYRSSQQSYGFWMIPPDIDTKVLVMFLEGDRSRGYWFACVPDEHMNFMVPDGRAVTELTTPGTPKDLQGAKLPVGEYNKGITTELADDTTLSRKPYNQDFTQVLEIQGLLFDEARGLTSSSARRETPSAVFGFNTPGPIDKRPGAPKAKIGTVGNEAEVHVSRLGGSSLVMDDGDDKLIREFHASDGPPVYKNKLIEESGGDETIPHNELIRLRTRTGHQILLHNSEDIIYIANSRGTAWIELTSDGKIDIHADDSISIMSDNDLNVTAERDINFEAGRNINMKASARFSDGAQIFNGAESGRVHIESVYDTRIVAGRSFQFTSSESLDLNVSREIKLTTKGDINMYAEGGSIYQKADLSFHQTAGQSWYRKAAGGDIVDIATGSIHQQPGADFHIYAPNNVYISALGGQTSISASQSIYLQADSNLNIKATGIFAADAPEVQINGGLAGDATPATQKIGGNSPTAPNNAYSLQPLSTHVLPYVPPGAQLPIPYESILCRAPQREPWTHHENMNPQAFKREETDREFGGELPSSDRTIIPDTFTRGTSSRNTTSWVEGSGGYGLGRTGSEEDYGASPRGGIATSPANQGPLATVRSKSGKTAQVAEVFKDAFQGFIDDLEATGYKIDVMYGYANRNAIGQGVKSYHASGAAIDINPATNGYYKPKRNPTPTDMPPNTGALAAKHGLGWGGNWNSCSDAMHFSAARREGGAWDLPRDGIIPSPVNQDNRLSTDPDAGPQ